MSPWHTDHELPPQTSTVGEGYLQDSSETPPGGHDRGMKHYDLLDLYAGEIPLPTLKPGMCIVLYTDKGPKGPCGQGGKTTCDHAVLQFYPDRKAMQEALEGKQFRHGQRADVRWFEVGNGGTGQLRIDMHVDVPLP